MDKNEVYRHLMDVYQRKMHQSHIKDEVYSTLEKFKAAPKCCRTCAKLFHCKEASDLMRKFNCYSPTATLNSSKNGICSKNVCSYCKNIATCFGNADFPKCFNGSDVLLVT